MDYERKIERAERMSADVNEERVAELRQLFPEAFTEGKVDFEKLRAALGDAIDERPERYSFSWAGKQDAIRILQTPTSATLAPAPDESLEWETTENIFIEGDNLEVLKLLYKVYFGKVKMIYIDPPYNTGNDFVYPDNYADPLNTYLQLTGQKDAEGNILSSNSESSGRFHSAWLTMMYSRLYLARQLLTEDGIMFVSINDDEVHHLRVLLDQIFGEEQFIGSFVWKSRHNVDSRNQTGMSSDHEYILVYGRRIQGRAIDASKYSNPDNDPRGDWMSDNMVGLATKDRRPNLHYDLINPETGINYGCPEKGWRYNPKTMNRKIADNRILWPSKPSGRPREKKFVKELKSQFTGKSSMLSEVPTTSAGTVEVRELFGADVFDFPKPIELIRSIVEQGSSGDDIVLDFFAGACPLSEAVFKQNLKDDQNRRFIVVQLPEPTADGSPARTEGYNTIAEIGKERIRRSSKKYSSNNSQGFAFGRDNEDVGFRVFKLETSNFRAWEGTADANAEEYAGQMELFADNLVDGWQADDVVWEITIKEGYPLTCRMERTAVAEQEVVKVTDLESERSFYVCLDDNVSSEVAAALELSEEDLLVCRDSALDDTTAANLALQCRLKTI
jgi:adenine-specific DNA-methyltransferase